MPAPIMIQNLACSVIILSPQPLFLKKEIKSSRKDFFLIPRNDIFVFGINFRGLVKNLSNDSSSQTTLEFFIALEYLYPFTEPAFRPSKLFRGGPILFLPSCKEWHATHFLKTFLPFTGSPAFAMENIRMNVIIPIIIRNDFIKLFMINLLPLKYQHILVFFQ